jgi:hypothetical protein
MSPRLSLPALGLVLLAVASCGSPAKKPSDADIAQYLTNSQPDYLRVGGVSASFEPVSDLGGAKLPAGSWRARVQFTLQAQRDLYAPTPGSLAMRVRFDHAVSAFEEFRVARIEAVEQLAKKVGLMPEGALAPQAAVALAISTHKGQTLNDHVTLLAQPAGKGWKFFQLDAQTLSDEAIGAPLGELRARSPQTMFVEAGSAEDRAYSEREQQFLQVLAKAGNP